MLLFERLFWGQVRRGRNVELFVNAAKLAGCCWNNILVSHDMSNVFYNAPQPNIQSMHVVLYANLSEPRKSEQT